MIGRFDIKRMSPTQSHPIASDQHCRDLSRLPSSYTNTPTSPHDVGNKVAFRIPIKIATVDVSDAYRMGIK